MPCGLLPRARVKLGAGLFFWENLEYNVWVMQMKNPSQPSFTKEGVIKIRGARVHPVKFRCAESRGKNG